MTRYGLYGSALDILRRVLTIVAYWVPLQAVVEIVREAAGQETIFDLKMQIGITIAFAESIGLLAQQGVIRRQRRDLDNAQKRIEGLEASLGLGLPSDPEVGT